MMVSAQVPFSVHPAKDESWAIKRVFTRQVEARVMGHGLRVADRAL